MANARQHPRGIRALVIGVLLLACGTATAAASKDSGPRHVRRAQASAQQLQRSAGVRALERRARERAAWRRGPDARRARRHSRTAYRHRGRRAVARVLRHEFASFLAFNDQAVRPEQVQRYTSDYTAILDGHRLAVSSMPLRTATAGGGKRPVDVTLASRGGDLAPVAALAPLTLPGTLADGVDLPAGISLTPARASDAAPSRLDADTALYPNVDTDTDLVASALPDGVELASVLRSPRSPEQQAFEVNLPAGAHLEAAHGGARVVRDGRTLLRVSPPTAADAQGAAVPTSLAVEGNTLRITTPHAGGDWAYPILVDPTYSVWDDYQWASGARGFDGWRGYNNSNFSLSNTCMYGIACFGPNGLYIYSWAGRSYFNGAVGGYEYYVPGAGSRTTYISRVVLSPLYQYRQPREYNLQPFLFVGLWDAGINDWANAQIAYDTYGYSNAMDIYSGAHAPQRLNVQQYSNANVTLSGHHVSYVGAVTIILDDGETPTLDPPVSSTGPPHWSAQDAGTVALHGHDNGLGVKYFTTRVPNAADGTLPVTEAPGCTGASRSVCPVDGHAQLSYDSASFPEGVNKIEVGATDAAGQVDEQSIKLMNVLVDRSGPELTVGGGLVDPDVPDHRLTVHAQDGDSSTFQTARSGVRTIEVLWDGQRADYEQRDCDNVVNGVDLGSCVLDLSGTVDEATWGAHTLAIVATDRAGNTTTRQWQVKLPDRTPPKIKLDGEMAQVAGDWVRPDKYSLTVSADDAGAGVVAQDVLVDGRSVDTATQSCTDGGCSLRHNFEIDFSNLAAGDHQVKVTSRDAADNSSSSEFVVHVDGSLPQVALSGELADASGTALEDRPYDLTISASDETAGSGIRTVSVLVDGAVARTFAHDCSSHCPTPVVDKFSFTPSGSSGGGSKPVDVVVEDGAGNINGDGVFAGPPPDLYSGAPAACPSAAISAPASGVVKAPEAAGDLLEAQPNALAPTHPGQTTEGDPVDPSLTADSTGLTAVGNLSGGGNVGLAAQNGITLGSAICAKPDAVSTSSTPATIVNGDAVLYANVANSTDLAVRPTSLGAAAFDQIRSPAAPETYSWDIGLRPGQHLEEVDAHTVAVVDQGVAAATAGTDPPATRLEPGNTADAQVQLAEGSYQLDRAADATAQPVVAVIRSPWVRDSAGSPVPATLTVDGNTITLAIVHREPPPDLEYDYPIVAETDFVSRGFGRCTISVPIIGSLPWPCALGGNPDDVDYSRLCVDPRGIMPGFRQFLSGTCVHRLKVRLAPLTPAKVAGAAAAAYGYCVRKHQSWTKTWQLTFATTVAAAQWCSGKRWLWVHIPGYWPNQWSG